VKALRILRDEHRSLAAVIHGLAYLARDMRHGTPPNFTLLGAMLHYIDAFPERFHHPKEDRYLFRMLLERCPQAGETIRALEEEHALGARKLRELHASLEAFQRDGASGLAPFAAAVEAYATFHWNHMRKEELDVLPLCEQHFSDADWQAIDAAFSGHDDPLLGVDQQTAFADLFRRIVRLAPPPIGLGSPATEPER
jgi:hemerythrin-like domain-containing protein